MREGLIVAASDDVHAFAVAYQAKQNGDTVSILDLSKFTCDFDLSTRYDKDESFAEFTFKDGRVIDTRMLAGLWWRRPDLSRTDLDFSPGLRDAILEERRQALIGSLAAFVPWSFNDPAHSKIANLKAMQLPRARQAGLDIPDTLITNSPVAAREFYTKHSGEVVYKIFGAPPIGVYPTRKVSRNDFRQLEALKACPCIFQENIKGAFDLRATIVGRQVFCARIDYCEDANIVDTRLLSTKCSQFMLPKSVEDSLLSLMESYGLLYGAIDMRYSEKRGYVFFEINPEGQYLWTEIDAGLDISRAIAHLLFARQQ